MSLITSSQRDKKQVPRAHYGFILCDYRTDNPMVLSSLTDWIPPWLTQGQEVQMSDVSAMISHKLQLELWLEK